jgi:hypothetical protein
MVAKKYQPTPGWIGTLGRTLHPARNGLVLSSPRGNLILENLALRQQLLALHSKRPRPRLGRLDKLFWVAMKNMWPGWRKSLILVTPETVVRGIGLAFGCTGHAFHELGVLGEENH